MRGLSDRGAQDRFVQHVRVDQGAVEIHYQRRIVDFRLIVGLAGISNWCHG